MRTFLFTLLLLVLIAGCRPLACRAQSDVYDSGGPLMPEQAAYDVTYYDFSVRVNPADSTIRGRLEATATIGSPIAWFVLDLDPLLDIGSIVLVSDTGVSASEPGNPLAFERRGGKVWINLPHTRQPGDEVTVAVEYGGRPRVAVRPPWDGGFTWARTAAGEPWIATSCQGEGADIWWPVKDHPSDEPDSMAIRVTVPAPLVVASNGRLRQVEEHADGWRTYHWFSSTPINTYNVALNIAPYRAVEEEYRSVTGETFPTIFFVLPEDYERGVAFMPEILDHLRFHEELLGPYPFRADKYGVAQTPHLGMEHQTIIAYGARFNNAAMTGRDWGFDALHHHELSHEWWGNLVTNSDWGDMWLHEGFGTYMQPLYVERLSGREDYHAYMNGMIRGMRNQIPLAPRGATSAKEIYRGDIYTKGAWVLHMLRYLTGDETFFPALRRMAYPDPALEQVTDGSHLRFATTDDFRRIMEEASGTDLGWFFAVYARQPSLPRLNVSRAGGVIELSWDVPEDLPFPMPVDVLVGDELRRMELPARFEVPADVDVEVDPQNWILRR